MCAYLWHADEVLGVEARGVVRRAEGRVGEGTCSIHKRCVCSETMSERRLRRNRRVSSCAAASMGRGGLPPVEQLKV